MIKTARFTQPAYLCDYILCLRLPVTREHPLMEQIRPVVLIYTKITSKRFLYVLQWIFEEQLQSGYILIDDIRHPQWQKQQGIKINYSNEDLGKDVIKIIPHPLLSQQDVRKQEPGINRWKHSTILFYNQPGALVPFDIFSAIFFLITRYEEYLPHRADKHGRFDHKESVASQFAFLQQPVVDEWILHFSKLLERKYNIRLPEKQFQYLPTYDIDIAWKHLYKGRKRTLGGYLKDFVTLRWKAIPERIMVLSGKKKDPFDCFDWLDSIHKTYQLNPIYFILLGQWAEYDKNADPDSVAMKRLMATLAQKYVTGIHPSYRSHEQQSILEHETRTLSMATDREVRQSRQHYIKFSMPDTFRKLINIGITDDYSMGYASCNGFRAGTSNAFPWYDIGREEITSLRIHPFAFMEATSLFYEKNNTNETYQEWERLYHAVKKVNGTFISIWHNYVLGTDRKTKGWRELYEKMLKEITDPGKMVT